MADNTFVNIGGHKVSAGIKYSTSEVKTGDVWIDGKPIYRRVFTGNLPTITTATYGGLPLVQNISIDTVVRWSGTQYYSSHTGCVLLPYTYCTGSNPITVQQTFAINYAGATLTYVWWLNQSAPAFSGQEYKIVVEYTKTTD